ncbi:hypothetical protein RCO31_34615, partial [Bradyrhizobium sp. LHD-71]
MAKLWHADQQRDGGTRSNAVDAEQQIEPVCHVLVTTKHGHKLGDQAGPALLQSGEIGPPTALRRRIADVLEPNFDPRHVLFGLFQPGQPFGKRRKSRIRRLPHHPMLRHEGRNQLRIDAVGLGATQLRNRIGSYLSRLKNEHDQARCAQVLNYVSLITTGRLQPDPNHLMLAYQAHQFAKAFRRIGHLPALLATVKCDVELLLCNIDSGNNRVRLAHLRRPFLVMRTHGSFNHPGPMKMPTAILLANSPRGSGALDPTIGDPLRVAARSGSFLSEQSDYSGARQYKERS